jgi:DHA2 family methylenomycin A resistance protein-like MFS transporter
MTRSSRWVVLVAMCVGYFLVLLDVTIVNVALPSMGSDLGASVSGLQWVVDGYAIALASLMLAGGSIGDLRGHKRVVLGGLALFGLASIACGLAPSTGALVGARVVQGAGAALLLPGTLAVIAHAFPQKGEHARAIGIWAGIGSVALPAGPLLGGALVQGVGWRAVFAVNAPIVLVAFVVPAAHAAPLGARSRRRRDPAVRAAQHPGAVRRPPHRADRPAGADGGGDAHRGDRASGCSRASRPTRASWRCCPACSCGASGWAC